MIHDTRSLGERLVESGKLDPANLELAYRESQKTGERLGTILQKMGMCQEADVLEALAADLGMRYVDLGSLEVDRRAVEAIPAKMVNHYQVFPSPSTATP